MAELTIGYTRFFTEPIEPFGLRLDSESPVDIADIVDSDLTKAVELVREHLVMVVQHNIHPGKFEWEEKTPRKNDLSSNAVWHYDGNVPDDIPVVILKTDGKVRKPTAIAKREPIMNAMRNQRHWIDPGHWNCPFADSDIGRANELYRLLGPEEPDNGITVHGIHKIYRNLGERWRAEFSLSSTTPNYKSELDKLLKIREGYQRNIREFIAAVNREIASETYQHDWNDNPQSAVLIYNGTENGNFIVAHRRCADVKLDQPETASIFRTYISDKKNDGNYELSLTSLP